MLIFKHITIYATVTSCIGHVFAGFPWSWAAPALSSINPSNAASIEPYIAQPVEPLQERKISLSDSLVKVKETFDSLETMPSCKKLAAKDLLHSCESFKDHRNGEHTSGDKYLETLQKLFAIRVTNCEQLDANDILPNICQPLLEIDIRSRALPKMISSCLEALNSGHPNNWTTYRHVKLEGLIMCTAMRAEANKDDEIYLLKIIFNTMNDVNGVITLQKNELEAITSGFRGLSSRMRKYQDALVRDNQKMRAQMMDISVEITGSMTGINEGAQVVLQVVRDIHEHTLRVQSELGSAIQLAKSRSDETDAQWAATLETRENTFTLVHEKLDYALEKLLASFHGSVYNMSQSIETANQQTSALASHIGELSVIMVNLPTKELSSLRSRADELVAKHQLIQEFSTATFDTVEATHKLVVGAFDFTEAIYAWFRSALGQLFIFALYCIIIFPIVLACMWKVFPPLIALGLSATFAVVFGACFAWLQSPVTFVRTIFAYHPTFFSPVIWSVLASATVGIILSESARQIYRYFSPSRRAFLDLRLPVNEHDDVDDKF